MDQNEILMNRAKAVIPGGVNSPVRAFKAVGGTPRFVTRAQGAYFWDANGQRYIDYIGSWGPMILGHGHPTVLEAVQKAMVDGLSFGAPTEREIELAEEIIRLMPSIEMVRLVSSGTEAAMSAIRLARGATSRAKIIKFEGCYHGHADALLVKAGSGLATLGTATSAGVPQPVIQDTVVLPFNDVPALEAVFDQIGHEIACIILEPIAGNMNFVRASQAFATRCRELCTRHGAVLIFDEVMTGFRVALGGAQSVMGITPDLTVLGKVIGGGMPLAAFGGKRDLMEQMAPVGPVYQAGTLSGNPVATACGLATLKQIQQPDFYAALAQKATALLQGWQGVAERHGQAFSFDLEGGMFGFFLLPECPDSYQSVLTTNAQAFNHLFHHLLNAGIYMAPALYEAGFVSSAHSPEDIETSVNAMSGAFLQSF